MGSDYICRLAEGISLQKASSDEAVNQVIENLNKFALVGVLEKVDIFARDYKSIFGAELHIERHNSNPASKSKQEEEITDKVRKKVEEICQPSIRVYESVLGRLSSKSI
jgi:CYTH domain-containing protein